MAKLQTPRFVYIGGKLRSWEEAVLHVGCEAVTRGLSVFEGIRGYWQPDGSFAIVMLRQHYARLCRSARILHIPFEKTYDEYKAVIDELIGALIEPGVAMWSRTTLYVTEGHWGEDTVSDLVVTAYNMYSDEAPAPINLGVSTWRRSPDVSLPARVKSGTNYQVGRLARIEGRVQGCQDMVLLNESGRVAEGTGSCLVMVRDGVMYTPPASEGALESITMDIVEALAGSMGIAFVHRPIERTELLIADEIALCGTLADITIAKTIEGLPLKQPAPILTAVQGAYIKACKGISPHKFVELSPLPSCSLSKAEAARKKVVAKS
jgi:branched-chain amino acid aminotransferase